jgi:hypothetical protein
MPIAGTANLLIGVSGLFCAADREIGVPRGFGFVHGFL